MKIVFLALFLAIIVITIVRWAHNRMEIESRFERAEKEKERASFAAMQKSTDRILAKANELLEDRPAIIYKRYDVAGVTFKNGRRHRQTILRQIKFRDPPYDGRIDVNFKRVDFEGEDAVEVWTNSEMVGYIAKKDVSEFLTLWDREGTPHCTYHSVHGGTPKADGSRTNYGMTISVEFYHV